MDVMKFEKQCPSLKINMEFSNEATWMEATDNFISFLQAAGYVFDPVEVGMYIIENYNTATIIDCRGCSCDSSNGCCR